MKFKYVGQAPDGQIVQYDVVFKPGEVSEVTDAFAVKKLFGNPFFEAVGGDDPVAAPAVEPKKRGPKPKNKDVVSDGEPNDAGTGQIDS